LTALVSGGWRERERERQTDRQRERQRKRVRARERSREQAREKERVREKDLNIRKTIGLYSFLGARESFHIPGGAEV